MKGRAGYRGLWGSLLAGAALGLVPSLLAQTATNPPAAEVQPRINRVAPPPIPLAFPPGKSPIEFFRELLALSPAERIQALTNRPVPSRKLILAKVREYEAFKPNQRELRLKATELRYYLWPLMSVLPSDRSAQIEKVPDSVRTLVQDRLQEWDQLSPEVQKQLLDNEATLRYFTDLSASTEEQKTNLLSGLTPARRELLLKGVHQWQSLPEEQRQKTLARFNRFFELTDTEKAKTLQTLSGPEQHQIEKTLRKFEQLSPAQRAQCIKSFEKFASLSLEERQQFLKNAERWKLMSPDERQDWKDLVSRLTPMPPMPESVPPMPARLRSIPRRMANTPPPVATNVN